MQTDRTIPNNKPGILTRDNGKRTGRLIDTALSGDRNVIKKAEKILKYTELIREIRRMTIMKANVIPVINGATGTISKSFRQHTGKARNQRTTKNRHNGHCTHTLERTNVKV
jgi:hypothetical protein